MGGNAFNSFIQTEVPLRPVLQSDAKQETIIVRRGVAPREVQGLELSENQTVIFQGGQLKAIDAPSLEKSAQTYVHKQETPATEWMIAHNMDVSSVIVQITADNKVFNPDEIEYVDSNTIKVTISDAIQGQANLFGFNE